MKPAFHIAGEKQARVFASKKHPIGKTFAQQRVLCRHLSQRGSSVAAQGVFICRPVHEDRSVNVRQIAGVNLFQFPPENLSAYFWRDCETTLGDEIAFERRSSSRGKSNALVAEMNLLDWRAQMDAIFANGLS